MTKVQRYKVGYYTDEWGVSSNTPCLIPDDSGFAVKFEDYCKLETENERLKHNLAVTEQTMREYQELAAQRLEEIAKYRDAPVVAWREFDGEGGYDYRSYDDNEDFRSEYRKRNPSKIYHDWVQPLIVKPGEEK